MIHPEEEEPGAAPPHEPAAPQPHDEERAWQGFADGAPPGEPAAADIETSGTPPVAPEPAARSTLPPARATAGAPWLSLLLFAVLAAGLFWVWGHPRDLGGDTTEIAALQRDVDATKQGLAQLQSQQQSQPQPDAGLTQQVQALSGRVDQLEKQIQSPPPSAGSAPSGNTDELAHRLDDVTSRVAALESRPAPAQADNGQAAPQPAAAQPAAPAPDQAALKPAIDQLAARVSRLEHGAGNVESVAERAGRVAQAQSALAALDAGKPLGPIAGAPPAVARFATTAPPTISALREQFPDVAEHIRAAMEPTGPNQGFLGRALARLERGITVREGDRVVVGAPQEAVLERAQDDVRIDDLAAAVSELGKLTGRARDAASPWMGQAQAVMDARAGLAQMAARG